MPPSERAIAAANEINIHLVRCGVQPFEPDNLAVLIDLAAGLPELEALTSNLVENLKLRDECCTQLKRERDAFAQRLAAVIAACTDPTVGLHVNANVVLRLALGETLRSTQEKRDV